MLIIHKIEVEKIMLAFTEDLKMQINAVKTLQNESSLRNERTLERSMREIIREESNRLNIKLTEMHKNISEGISYAIATVKY